MERNLDRVCALVYNVDTQDDVGEQGKLLRNECICRHEC